MTGLFLSASWTATASAQGVALTRTNGQSVIAVAGSRVLLAPGTYTGSLLHSYSVAGGPPRPVGTALSPPSPGRGFPEAFDASESTVAAIRTRETRTGGNLDSRVFAGPIDGALQALGPAAKAGRLGSPSLVRVSGQATLVGVLGRGSDPALSVHPPGAAAVRLPAFPGTIPVADIAGDLVAIAPSKRDADPDTTERLVVLNWRTGRRLYDRTLAQGIGDLDLAPDGRVVVSTTDQDRLILVSPAGATRVLARDRRASLSDPIFAGDRIIAVRSLNGHARATYVVAVSSSSGRIAPLSPRTDDLEALDADATTVSWIANGCALATATSGPRMRIVPPGPCFRDELTIRGRRTRLTTRKVIVDLYCHSSSTGSCRGTLRLHVYRDTKSLAKRRFTVHSGRHKAVALLVSRATARRLRRGSRDLAASTVLRDAARRTRRELGFVPLRIR